MVQFLIIFWPLFLSLFWTPKMTQKWSFYWVFENPLFCHFFWPLFYQFLSFFGPNYKKNSKVTSQKSGQKSRFFTFFKNGHFWSSGPIFCPFWPFWPIFCPFFGIFLVSWASKTSAPARLTRFLQIFRGTQKNDPFWHFLTHFLTPFFDPFFTILA